MTRAKNVLISATVAATAAMTALPADAFMGPFSWMRGGGWGGPWYGYGYPYYGYGYPYWGYPYYGWGAPYGYGYPVLAAPIAVQPAATSDK